MKVKIRLLMSFAKYGQDKLDERGFACISDNATLGDLLALLEIPLNMPKNILINTVDKNDLSTVLHEGDQVVIYRLICGG